jgi:hypothetical protein
VHKSNIRTDKMPYFDRFDIMYFQAATVIQKLINKGKGNGDNRMNTIQNKKLLIYRETEDETNHRIEVYGETSKVIAKKRLYDEILETLKEHGKKKRGLPKRQLPKQQSPSGAYQPIEQTFSFQNRNQAVPKLQKLNSNPNNGYSPVTVNATITSAEFPSSSERNIVRQPSMVPSSRASPVLLGRRRSCLENAAIGSQGNLSDVWTRNNNGRRGRSNPFKEETPSFDKYTCKTLTPINEEVTPTIENFDRIGLKPAFEYDDDESDMSYNSPSDNNEFENADGSGGAKLSLPLAIQPSRAVTPRTNLAGAPEPRFNLRQFPERQSIPAHLEMPVGSLREHRSGSFFITPHPQTPGSVSSVPKTPSALSGLLQLNKSNREL